MNRELLHRFFRGEVSEEEQRQVKLWMEASKENEEHYRKERNLFDLMLLSVEQECEKEVRLFGIPFSRKLYFSTLKIASIVLVVLGVSAFLYFNVRHFRQDNLYAHSIEVPLGQRVKMVLPDSSVVWLNSDTKFSYRQSFVDNREVLLDGEAYFEVISTKEKSPFTVHTKQMDIQVLGTKFNVKAYSNQSFCETSLMEGRVKAIYGDKSILLLPNQKITLVDGKSQINKITDFDTYRWKEGLYCFKNEKLRDILKNLERYYGVYIQVDNSKAAEESLTGKFRISEGIDYTMRVLQNEIAFHWYRKVNSDTIYIE